MNTLTNSCFSLTAGTALGFSWALRGKAAAVGSCECCRGVPSGQNRGNFPFNFVNYHLMNSSCETSLDEFVAR